MKPFPLIAKPIGIAALLLGATLPWYTDPLPSPPAAIALHRTTGLPDGGRYLRPWMDEAQPYTINLAWPRADHGSLPHGSYAEMIIDWNDGPIDPGTDHLRFNFHWVDDTLGEAWSAARRADHHDPVEPCDSPVVRVVEEVDRKATRYQEHVLAHLHGSLTVPAAAGSLPTTEEPPVPEEGHDRRYGVQADPRHEATPSLVRCWHQRLAESSRGMDPGMHVDAPPMGSRCSTATPPEEQPHLLEELQRLLLGTMDEQYEHPNTTPSTKSP